ncbi:PIR protein [Plasmodium vivax]|uniref:VIR protein n=1 Tax=Plasmodium vivax TaxID=5855 RepID=A0A565A6M7_PLAVI|nr:PIR protein [Plasmodium vivax]
MTNFLGNTKLSILNTKYYYTSLNEAHDDCQNEAFYNIAKKKLEDYDWLQDVSEQILKGLCYVYRKRLKNNFESDICKFLYFWLGNILYDKLKYNILFFDVINNLFDILKDDNMRKICILPHTYMDVNHFKKIKFFFDYSEDYNSYKQQLAGNNHFCNNDYKTYLDTYVKSYKDVKVECAKNPNLNSYCEQFNQYFKDKYDYDLSNWKCVLDEHGHEEEELEEDNVAQDPLLSPGSKMGAHSATEQNELPNVIGQEENSPGTSGYPLRERTADMNNISEHPDDSSPSTIKKSITSAVSAAGLLVPPFLVYNFTPARSWINKLLGRKQTYRNPLTERELIENSYQPDHFDSERNRYNIWYRPE